MFGKRRRRPADSFDVAMRDAEGRARAGRVTIRDGQGDLVHSKEWGDWDAVDAILQDMRSRAGVAGAMMEMRPKLRTERSGEVTVSWSFRTNTVVALERIPRRVIGICPKAMSEMKTRSGTEVTVRHASRSRTMFLMMSPGLKRYEVGLNEADIADLGLSDGVTGYLEVFRVGPQGEGTARPRGSGPRKVKVAARSAPRTDNDTPPYTVERGLGFWRRRKRV